MSETYPQRLKYFQDLVELELKELGVEDWEAHKIARETAQRADRIVRPRSDKVAKVLIQDTFEKNKSILIVLSSDSTRDAHEVLERHLSRKKGVPPFDKWRVEEKTGAPGMSETAFLCTVKPPPKAAKKASSKKQAEDITTAILGMSKEEKQEALAKLQKLM